MDDVSQGPRFEAYLKNNEDWRVLSMDREAWDRIIKQPDNVVEINIAETPMSCVEACITACVGQQYASASPGQGDGFIHVYRQDEADFPNRVNTDKYEVWFGKTLKEHPKFMSAVIAAATAADANLDEHLRDRVYFLKQKPDADHHLPELPQHVKAVINPE